MTSPPTAESALRNPREWPIFVTSAALNLVIMAGAVVLAAHGTEELRRFPRLASIVGHRIEELRALAIAAVFALPAVIFLRNLRRASIRGGSVRLSSDQLPEIHDVLVRYCARLGMKPIPRLYLTDEAFKGDARAFSSWDGDYIVLGTKYLNRELAESHEVVAFLLGRELGTLRLGHTRWWNEALIAYVVRIPILRRPLRRVRAFSRDRYAAFLAPEGLRGLLVVASGGSQLPNINISAWLEQVREYEGFWAWLSAKLREAPHVADRVRALYAAGLFRSNGDPLLPGREPRRNGS
jgi:hypothetical protein